MLVAPGITVEFSNGWPRRYCQIKSGKQCFGAFTSCMSWHVLAHPLDHRVVQESIANNRHSTCEGGRENSERE